MNKNFAKYLLLLMVAGVFLTSCKEYKTTDSGLQYKYLVKSDTGEVAGLDGYLGFQMEIKSDDSIYYSTYRDLGGKPAYALITAPRYAGCYMEGMAMLRAGDSVRFKVQGDSFYLKSIRWPEVPKGIDSGEYLYVTIKVVESMNKESFEKFQKEQAKQQALEAEKKREAELAELEKYAAEKGYTKLQRSPGGFLYSIIKSTDGPTLKNGEIASMNYIGTFLDGKEFDSNRDKGPFMFVYGEQGFMPAWTEALQMIKKGEKWMMFIPSSLAYGEEGSGPVPPNAPLIFDMELTGIFTKKELLDKEKKEVDAYCGKIKGKTTASGLCYTVEKSVPGGTQPNANDRVAMKIEAFDIKGKKLDMMDPTRPFEFNISGDRALECWREVVQLMRVGERFRIVTPSALAFGGQGYQGVPPYSPLVFVLTLEEIKKQ